MKRLIFIFVIFAAISFFHGNADAICNCKQPFYKDDIDFLKRYTACLEECYNSQIENLNSRLNEHESRAAGLESEIERLRLKIKYLEKELLFVKTKSKSKN
ncbi:MAG: hypothetical protein JSU83_24805 [Deltaproteobacteria bacterium]|nr:MAG: hypothetical protein JSU83_24805 [Deltaproteobacteria bacterium]